ncbi:MAG: 23S rRNA (guanosine(2251)-2'-O)-methyltransferase RlmB [Actinobacteria bacterium]|nr:23S rRNA (guanosine(2251)-2'-O)-methyltransferase RlmB [Actinomycetota bacterium]MBU4490602.1 23S rRNA (guanosine(2251)-2'-O)-methyltransferase RlmB [Actinomycetota bacterium]
MSSPESDDRVEGRNPVLEALRGPRDVGRVYIAEGTNRSGIVEEIIGLAGQGGAPVISLSREEFSRMARTSSPQGILASVSRYRYATLDELTGGFKDGRTPLVLILDGVEDPRNFGSLLRVADAVGASGVIIARRRSSPVTAVVAKASAGAVEHVTVAKVASITGTLLRMKDEGLWVVGADAGSDELYYRLDLTVPVAVVLGGEGKGLRRLVKERCDYLARLPMSGRISSLNVSTAAAALLFEALRQREVS